MATIPTAVDPCADLIGPRQVGGVYESGYWHIQYRVVAIDRRLDVWPFWRIWVIDTTGLLAGETRWHCTAWDERAGDRVIQQPARAA